MTITLDRETEPQLDPERVRQLEHRRWRQREIKRKLREDAAYRARFEEWYRSIVAAPVREDFGGRPLNPPEINWRPGAVDFEVRPDAWRKAGAATWDTEGDALRECLQAATAKLASDKRVVVKMEPGIYRSLVQITTPSGSTELPSWSPTGNQPTLVLFNADPSKQCLIEGGITWMGGRGEIWGIDITMCTRLGGSAIIGSPGARGIMRLKNPKFIPPIDPDQLPSFGGTGVKWPVRRYLMGLHTEDADWSQCPCQEHDDYSDNPIMTAHVRPHFGPAGRTDMQGGTRVDTGKLYGLPDQYLGIGVFDWESDGLHSGAGGGSGLTVWGYPGIVVFGKGSLRSSSTGNMLAANRVYSIWEATNFNGTIDPENDGYSTDLVWIDGIDVNYPGATRPFGELESVRSALIGRHTGTIPKNWVDCPDQYISGYVGELGWLPGDYQHIAIKAAVPK